MSQMCQKATHGKNSQACALRGCIPGRPHKRRVSSQRQVALGLQSPANRPKPCDASSSASAAATFRAESRSSSMRAPSALPAGVEAELDGVAEPRPRKLYWLHVGIGHRCDGSVKCHSIDKLRQLICRCHVALARSADVTAIRRGRTQILP
jgi:hypothetical protein